MVTVCDLDMCVGCMACLEVCKNNAIRIRDSMKSFNAVIDETRCTACNACRAVCQSNEQPVFHRPIYWTQGWANSVDIRDNSTSGGYASAIETSFIKKGGIVCSCVFENGEFVFGFAKDKDEVLRFSGSKYVKSNPLGIYEHIKKLLEHGEKVLFVGLPCQAAAVKKFVGEHINLYTIDLICHGTPSSKVLKSFLADYDLESENIEEIRFRDNVKHTIRINGKCVTISAVKDWYTFTFSHCVSLADNCYHCKYARIERVTDMTLGDSWGSRLPTEEINRGISLALCQSEKGMELLKGADLYITDIDIDEAIKYHYQLRLPSIKDPKRDIFLEKLQSGESFRSAFRKCFPGRYIKDSVKTFLSGVLGETKLNAILDRYHKIG